MDLTRGVLSKLDRALMAATSDEQTSHMVRVPATPRLWATWKLYCERADVSIGRAIIELIRHELASVTGEIEGDTRLSLDLRSEEELRAREVRLSEREEHLETAKKHLRLATRQLHQQRLELERRELELQRHRMQTESSTLRRPGRNDPCYCGSARKFKSCHGAVA